MLLRLPASLLCLTSLCYAQTPAERAAELLPQLSLEEKVGQMTQLTLTVFESEPGVLDEAKLREAIVDKKIGSILNVPNPAAPEPEKWAEIMRTIEKLSGETEHTIPILYGIDTIHGANYTKGSTLFPQQIGMAATFNTDLVKKAGQVAAYETRASSIPWVFSPDLDLPRNPLWSRNWETFGQSVHLSSEMGLALLKGYEGESLAKPDTVAACIKHFVGYGTPTTGKDRTPSLIPDRLLKQEDIEIFRPSIEAGARSIMIASGEVNGTPVHANKRLLTDVLQTELGFKGLVLTDWEDIVYLHKRHKVAPTMKDAVRLAINAGIDMSMVPYDYEFTDLLIELVNEGAVSMDRIDSAVEKILTLKYELGLFDRSLVADAADYEKFGSQEFAQVAYDTAAESITLLRNSENLLPLGKDKKIFVGGPAADSVRALNGGWTYTWQGEKSDEWAPEVDTVLEALVAEFGEGQISYAPGSTFEEEVDYADAVAKAKNSDVIVLCLGENSYTETPGDINDLRMSWPQQALALELAKLDKPMVLVLLEGRTRTIDVIEGEFEGIIHAYLPGNEGGRALADILSGDVNPSGALPMNYPRTTGSTQLYNYKGTEGLTDPIQAYNPLFELGDGLSYTTFSVSNLDVSPKEFEKGQSVTVTATIKNEGQRGGKCPVQVYVTDHFASITPEEKSLKAFDKVELAAGESKEVTFELPHRAFEFVNNDLEWVSEAGTFTIAVGDQTTDLELVTTE